MAYNRLHQGDVARAAGLTQPQLSRRLRGHTEFKAAEVAKIADHLGVKVADLYEGMSRSGYFASLPVSAGQSELLTREMVPYNASPSLSVAV